LAASVVLAGFFGLTGFILDKAYRNSAESALQERLQGYAYALVAVIEPDLKGEVHLMNALPIPRFFTPGSGLYARVMRNDGRYAWQSPSMNGLEIPFPTDLARGVHSSKKISLSKNVTLYTFNTGVSWEEETPLEEVYTFSIAENLDSLNVQINSFRQTLWGSLGTVAILLLAVQGVILRWGLRPLRRVATDLSEIESGKKTRLEGRYPRELRTLTNNLNALVNSERDHLQRFRNALGDLAHSLKTPLALIRSTIETGHSHDELRNTVEEQVERMNHIIEYHLQRGATSGRTVMAAPVAVEPVVRKVLQAMKKIYADKKICCHVHIPADVHLVGDESDLLEIVGNLIDNAFKWCRSEIIVSAEYKVSDDGESGLMITIEDDGPGIAAEMKEEILKRGIRGDQLVPSGVHTPSAPEGMPGGPQVAGHGIGLAMVQDIIQVYTGHCEIGSSSKIGGACIAIYFPS